MEIRNLQKTGGSSFTITLPKEWITRFNLKDKDKVIMDQHKSGSISILPYYVKKIQHRTIISISNLTLNAIVREIIAHYIVGVDELVLKENQFTSEQKSAIRKVTRDLVGMEIIEETSNKIIIKNVFDNRKFSISDSVEKMFLIIIAMYEDVMRAIENRDKNLAIDIIDRDVEIDRLYLTVVRQLHSLFQDRVSEEEVGLSLEAVHYYETVATQLERIADHTVKMSRMVVVQSKKSQMAFTQTLKRKTKKILIFLQQIEKTSRLQDKHMAHEILDLHQSLSENTYIGKDIIKKSSIDIIIEDSIDRIRGYIMNIAEEIIDYLALKAR